jgi:hypothetical protein
MIAIALSPWLAYHQRLYLVLTIPLNQYDTFVRKIDPSSQESHILISGVFERQAKSDHFERFMHIMCTVSEAAMLLDVANQLYPDIAPEIARYIARATGA